MTQTHAQQTYQREHKVMITALEMVLPIVVLVEQNLMRTDLLVILITLCMASQTPNDIVLDSNYNQQSQAAHCGKKYS